MPAGLFAVFLLAALASPCPDAMVGIPQGNFWMGSDRRERTLAAALSGPAVRATGWFDAELPRQPNPTGPFCIARLLVTQQDYAAFIRATDHRTPGISKAEYIQQGFLVHDYDREVTPYLWQTGSPPADRLDQPVVLVDAHDAAAYCRWRFRGGRLPTETEWERAARGDDGRMFPWGDGWDANRVNSAEHGPHTTTPVTRYPSGASPYGLRDAVGNVFQWTASTLTDGRQILKGCAWDDDAGLCRPAFRHGRPPASRHILIGFRCAAVPDDN